MMTNELRIKSTVDEGRVKLHVFKPSNRRIWTVVGKGKEHWLEPELDFCSCPAFYFGNLTEKKPCYHLESVQTARKENKVELIVFSDEEFSEFIHGIVADL